jgi:voltage-gated potassium channel
MTSEHDQDLPPAKRRRLMLWTALGSLLTATALVVLYYVLPLDRRSDSDTAVRLLVGLLVVAGLMVWQVRSIAGSRHLALQAAQALGSIIPLYLVLFASTYVLMARASTASFTQPLTRTDALYFTVTVFATLGFGDITAKSETTRVVLIVPMLDDLAVLGSGQRVLLGLCAAPGNEDQIPAMTAAAARDSLPVPRASARAGQGLKKIGGAESEYVLAAAGQTNAAFRCLSARKRSGAARQCQRGHRPGQGHSRENRVGPAPFDEGA